MGGLGENDSRRGRFENRLDDEAEQGHDQRSPEGKASGDRKLERGREAEIVFSLG